MLVLHIPKTHRTTISEEMTRRKVTRTKATPNTPRGKVVCRGCKSIKQRCERIPGQEACVRCHNTGKPCIEAPGPRGKSRRGSKHPQVSSSSSTRTDQALEKSDSAPNTPRSSPLLDPANLETERVDGNSLQKPVGMYDLMQVSPGISRDLRKRQ